MRMIQRAGLVVALLGGVPLEAARAAQAGPPPAAPPEPVSLPEVHERALSNGSKVIIVENHEQPVVTVNLRIRSGSAANPRGKAGLAELTAGLLNKGTPTRDARQIAEATDFVGASIGAGAGDDWTSVTATSLTEFLDTALVLLSDIVMHPTFPAEELEIERKRVLSALRLELSQPNAVAQRRLLSGLYGEHPYGALPTTESVEALRREDLVAFHRTHYRPNDALFVVAGDVEPAEILRRLESHFRGWGKSEVPRPARPRPPARTERQIRLYHKPGSVQAVVRVGHLVAPATDPDWVALDVALRVLGGGSSGWLFEVLREEKGYTYGAYASAAKRSDRGYFQAFAEVRNEVTDSAVAELFRLIEKIRAERVPDEDLNLAKDYITGSFPREIETPQQVAGEVATARLLGLPSEYLEKYRTRVAAVTAADVRRVARAHLHPDRALVVVVGDAQQILDRLTPFGPVELFDVEGQPLAREDLEVRAAEVAFDPSGIEPHTLVYSFLVQDNPAGEFTVEVLRETVDGREVVRSTTAGGGAGFSIDEEVVFDANTFEPISFRITQQAGPGKMEVELRKESGKVVGRVTPMQGEPQEVDAEVPEGTLLPGMDSFVLLLADFAKDREIKIPAFNALSASPYTASVKVVGDTTIQVAAGTFETYVVELTGAQGTQRIHVRKAAPHILVRQEVAPGQPVFLELKEIR